MVLSILMSLLILDGHESHNSLDIENYCKSHNIITLCMPPHLSHLLQPLNVGIFSSLKKAYRRQAENLIPNRINNITKTEFHPYYIAAFRTTFTNKNIQGGFRGVSLVPFNSEAVVMQLDVHLRNSSPPPIDNSSWDSKTPINTFELRARSSLGQGMIRAHANSSLSVTMKAFEKFSKGADIICHKLLLAQKEIAQFRAANEASSHRKLRKRKQIQQQSTFTVENRPKNLFQKRLKHVGIKKKVEEG